MNGNMVDNDEFAPICEYLDYQEARWATISCAIFALTSNIDGLSSNCCKVATSSSKSIPSNREEFNQFLECMMIKFEKKKMLIGHFHRSFRKTIHHPRLCVLSYR